MWEAGIAELKAAELGLLTVHRELRLGAAEHLGEQMAEGMAAGDCDKGLASVTRCCLFLSRGEAKNGNGVGLSSWTRFPRKSQIFIF